MMDVQHAGKTATAKLNISTPCQDLLDKFVKEFYFSITQVLLNTSTIESFSKTIASNVSTYFLLS